MSDKDNVELKPCPFCGSRKAAYRHYIDGTEYSCFVQCEGCGASGKEVYVDVSVASGEWDDDIRKWAAAEWNRRSGVE